MSLTGTGTRLLAVALVALLLFVSAFLVARGDSSQAAPGAVREQPAAGSGAIRHAPLRAIGSVPVLPRAARKPTPAKPPAPPPPPVGGPVAPPPRPPPAPPPPPAPSSDCVGEFC